MNGGLPGGQDSGNTAIVCHPSVCGRTDHVQDQERLDVVIGKVSCEDWFVVGCPVAQSAEPLQIAVQVASRTHHVGEGMLQDRHPQALVVPVGQKSSPEPKAQLSNDMARRVPRPLLGPHPADRVPDAIRLKGMEWDPRIPPVGSAKVSAQLVVHRVAKRDLKHVEIAPQRRGHRDVPGVEPDSLGLVTAGSSKVGGVATRTQQDGYCRVVDGFGCHCGVACRIIGV